MSALPGVIPRTLPSAHPTPVPIPPPHRGDQYLLVLVELDRFHDRWCHAQQPTPYPGSGHVVASSLRFLFLNS